MINVDFDKREFLKSLFNSAIAGVGLYYLPVAFARTSKSPSAESQDISLRKEVKSLEKTMEEKIGYAPTEEMIKTIIYLEERIAKETIAGKNAKKFLFDYAAKEAEIIRHNDLRAVTRTDGSLSIVSLNGGWYDPESKKIFLVLPEINYNHINQLLEGESILLGSRIHEFTHALDYKYDHYGWFIKIIAKYRSEFMPSDSEDLIISARDSVIYAYRAQFNNKLYKKMLFDFAMAHNKTERKKLPLDNSEKSYKQIEEKFKEIQEIIVASNNHSTSNALTETHAMLSQALLYSEPSLNFQRDCANTLCGYYEIPEHMAIAAVKAIGSLYSLKLHIQKKSGQKSDPLVFIKDVSEIVGSFFYTEYEPERIKDGIKWEGVFRGIEEVKGNLRRKHHIWGVTQEEVEGEIFEFTKLDKTQEDRKYIQQITVEAFNKLIKK